MAFEWLSFIKLLFTVMLLLFFYSIGLVIYRLYFHPLSKFPGPKLAAVTRWYEFYFDILKGHGGQFMFEIDRLHEKYGAIIRVNPDELHIRDPKYYDTLYRAGSAVRDKYPASCLFAGTPLGAPLAAYFSRRVYRSADPIFRGQVDAFCDRLRTFHSQGKTTDIRVDYLSTATEIISSYAFGHPIGLHDLPEEAGDWLLTVKAIAAVSSFFKQYPYLAQWLLPCPEWLVKILYPVFAPSIRLHTKMQREASEACKKINAEEKIAIWSGSPETRPPIVFEVILKSDLPSSEKTVERLDHDAFTAIFGGGDLAARTLTNCTFWLLTNPPVLRNMQRELDVAIPDPSRWPGLQAIEELPYLNAVMKRVFEAPSHLNVSTRGRTPVGMSLRHVLHDQNIFPDPHVFKPERWLDTTGKINPFNDKYYVPFHRGHGMCLGYNFATTMMLMTLAGVFRRFDLELVDTVYKRDVKIVRDCFIGEVDPHTKGVKIRVLAERE